MGKEKAYVWDDLLTETDREVIRRGGYGQPRGLGKHPAMLIIDPQYNYAGADRPILEQIREWPSGAGEAAWRSVEHIRDVLKAFRDRSLPVIFTRHIQHDLKFDGFVKKTNRNQSAYLAGSKGTAFISSLLPADGEIIIDKSYASVFYGTPIQTYLVSLGVDTLIVTGGTTCGCVRAACVDAVSRGFNCAVVTDCVYDRISVSHKASLLDLWMKYCDVVDSDEVIAYLGNVEKPVRDRR
jgi:maleamate amidohydrolase